MEYIRQMNAFALKSVGVLDTNAGMLYFRLFMRANSTGWKDEWIAVTNEYLMAMTGIGSHHTIIAARDKLKENGFIDFIPGGKHRPTMYKLLPLTGCASASYENQTPFPSENQATIKAANQANMPEFSNQAHTEASTKARLKADMPESNGNPATITAEIAADMPESLPTNIDYRHKTKNKQQQLPARACAYPQSRAYPPPQEAAAAAASNQSADVIPFSDAQGENANASNGRDAPERWEEVVEAYEQIRPLRSSFERNKLMELVTVHTAETVIEAVKEAIYSGGQSLRYVERILERWKEAGITSNAERSTGTYGTGSKSGNGARVVSYRRMAGGYAKKTFFANRHNADNTDWSKEPDGWN